MVETVVVLLLGLVLTWVSGSLVWAFVCELKTDKWASDFALGVASAFMLIVGLVITVCALMYLVARL